VDTQKDADVYGSPAVWTPPAPPAARPVKHRHTARRHRRHHRRRAQRRHRRHPRPRRVKPERGTVYIGTSSLYGELNDPAVNVRGSVVALNAATGALRWKTFTVPDHHDGGSVWSTPAIDPGTGRLYVGTGNAYHAPAADTTDSVLSLDARSGQIVAKAQATADDVWNATEGAAGGPDYDFGASPNLFAAPDGRKLVGAGQKSGAYWAFDSATMKPVWTATTGPGAPVVGGIVGSTATDGHRIYGPDTPAGEIWALGTDGSPAWVSSDGGPIGFGAVSSGNGVVWSTGLSATLTGRDAATGAIVAKLPLGAPSWGGVALAGGSVFAVTGAQGSSGWVVAYRPRG
jgi:polyvinyl alcohol dehydrogenase (cytochrome)